MKYINEGQDVNHKDYSGLTPLHDAVAHGDIEVILPNFSAHNLGSAPTTYIGSRVGSDFPRTSILNVGSGRVGSVIWSVGWSEFLKLI
jgi:ankyrin repeat protein